MPAIINHKGRWAAPTLKQKRKIRWRRLSSLGLFFSSVIWERRRNIRSEKLPASLDNHKLAAYMIRVKEANHAAD